jgi:hypothetical protein
MFKEVDLCKLIKLLFAQYLFLTLHRPPCIPNCQVPWSDRRDRVHSRGRWSNGRSNLPPSDRRTSTGSATHCANLQGKLACQGCCTLFLRKGLDGRSWGRR